ncbi:hypothetical protein CDCA_CDCA11G3209 [Cyanidium caldarium]|uniref:GOLD domain-containing protein n=1 Tax=Cyanidium caldarium TaxID=2771 RepID=A0AAV9IYK8_CYACA|nr:hypothetical protein CDCA_CDCA11G3209 [Cyanidium caldarium]
MASRLPRRRLCPLLLFLLLLLHLPSVDALQFFLKGGQRKCFSEDVTAGTRVLGEYLVTAAGGGHLQVDLKVSGPDEKIIYSKENIDHGKFTFQAPSGPEGQRGSGHHGDPSQQEPHQEGGDGEHAEWDEEYGDVWPTYTYHFCVQAHSADAPDTRRKVTLQVNTGAAAKDYATVAKVEHLDNLEVALRRMEDEVRSIQEELEHMRAREEAMRSINEGVSRRVLWYSFISCCVMVAAGIWQARYLNAFFKAKKLI